MLKPYESVPFSMFYLGYNDFSNFHVGIILFTLQKIRKNAVQTARNKSQSEILQRSMENKTQQKTQGCGKDNMEILRLRRRLREAEARIEKLEEEKDKYKSQFLQLTSNLAEVVNVNLEMHKMLAAKHASISPCSGRGENGKQCCDFKW